MHTFLSVVVGLRSTEEPETMKKRIDIIASTEAYENLRTFESIEQLNEAVRYYRDTYKLNKTELAVLELLKRYSCRYFGVSFLRKSVIGELVGKSRRTIIRVVKRLAELGIVKQYEMKRANDMQQTSNAIVIMPVSEIQEVVDVDHFNEQKATVTQSNVTHKTNSILKHRLKEYKERNDAREQSDERYDYTYVSSSIPSEFTDVIGPRLGSAKDFYRMWGRLKLAARKSNLGDYINDYMADFVKTFKEALYIYKTTNLRADIYGYMYGAWRNTAALLARRKHAQIGWIEV